MSSDAEARRSRDYDPEEALLVRLAWACEIEGLTQAEAARQFGLTRLRVNQALAEARRRGVVRVQLQSTYSPCASLERQLMAAYDLRCVCVAPRVSDAGAITRQVGAALGHHLNALLADNRVKRIGMTWGNTLNLAMRYMQPLDRPDLEVVSAMGGLSIGADQNVVETTRSLARLCRAKKSYFTAPLYAESAYSRDVIVSQAVFQTMIEQVRGVDTMITALGDTSESSMLIREGLPPSVEVKDLVAAGAVGDVLGYFIDAEGACIDHPINHSVIGIDLQDLAAVPNVIVAAGGLNKAAVIQAALRNGFVNTLITDEGVAEWLVSAGA